MRVCTMESMTKTMSLKGVEPEESIHVVDKNEAQREIDEIMYYIRKIKEVYQSMNECDRQECERRVMNLIQELVDLGILDVEQWKQCKEDRDYFLEETKRMYSFLVDKMRKVRKVRRGEKRVVLRKNK